MGLGVPLLESSLNQWVEGMTYSRLGAHFMGSGRSKASGGASLSSPYGMKQKSSMLASLGPESGTSLSDAGVASSWAISSAVTCAVKSISSAVQRATVILCTAYSMCRTSIYAHSVCTVVPFVCVC